MAGVEPSEGFLERAKEQLAGRALLQRGNATAIPLRDDSVDACVAALVLNFVPDGGAALREMSRVTVAGGTIAAYVWDYAGKMERMPLQPDGSIALTARAWAVRGHVS